MELNDEKNTEASITWLQRLKDESWEAELLVSTVAIFGTFQLFGLIDWLTNMFIDLLNPSQYFIGYMIVFFGLIAISVLAAMFLIHFILRAYWVGLVGLNSVFPDYSIKHSAYSEIYTKKILSVLPKLKDSIKKVDELSSVVFSVAFTFLFMYAYVAFIASIYILLFNLLSAYISTYVLLIPVLICGLIMLLQSVIGILAKLKRYDNHQKIQTLYFKIVRLGAIVTCGPFYKSVLQVMMIFGSNFKKKKAMVYLLFTFLIFGVIVAISQFHKTNITFLMNNKKYDDDMHITSFYYASENKKNNFLIAPEIESDFTKEKVLKVFVPIFKHEKRIWKNTCDAYIKDSEISKPEEALEQDERNNYLDCYRKHTLVYVNGEKISVDFLTYDHPRTKQFGMLGYLKLTNPKEGINRLEFKKIFDDLDNNKEWSIPFYYAAK